MHGTFPRPLPGAPDCNWLGPGGVVMLGNLTVAFLSPGIAEEVALAKLQQLCGKVMKYYRSRSAERSRRSILLLQFYYK